MKQVLQNLGSGETILADVPCPQASRTHALIESRRSLVSLGTEKMLIDFGKGSFLAKARQQPDKVKQVLQKIKTDGLWSTLDAVKAKLDQPIPLGYCNAGNVVDLVDSSSFRIGDRVVSNGPHAEMVSVPQNLLAKIPDEVSDDEAAFTVLGAIALQGIRLLAPTLGERIVVSGLGLIGLIAVQLLRANGCQVLGIDFDPKKIALAKLFGAETVDLSAGQDPVAVSEEWTKGIGVDGVLVTASTKSDEVMHQAATMCRKRGKIVLVGVVGLHLRRSDFYEKELSFQVSCSYGPGRYDPNYEKKGLDYPIGYVRWTEQRNFEAILHLLAQRKLDVTPLITHRYPFEKALQAYETVGAGNAMGILLDYSSSESTSRQKRQTLIASNSSYYVAPAEEAQVVPKIAFLGAGGFATRTLLPTLAKLTVERRMIVSQQGATAAYAAKKFGFAMASSSSEQAIRDDQVNTVFISTPHHNHAALVCSALAANKHVFVEKPLALDEEQLIMVEEAISNTPSRLLMVGFNRRFSPHTQQLKKWLSACSQTKSIIITVNAGDIPAEHWIQDPQIGGGRILGEACHFIDLARYLINSPIRSVRADYLGGNAGMLRDSACISTKHEDGSIATIHYLAYGHKSFPKERIEIFTDGDVMVCDNFRVTSSRKLRKRFTTRSQDKGHHGEVVAFLDAVKAGATSPIPVHELIEVSRATIQAAALG
jgi:predicted dehydrogenase/threonine dehydrogenase-like Zn-dependent dehydrogenase